MLGCMGNVPLPPLKGVLTVLKSSPLRKSSYSLSRLTLACASRAPMSTTRASVTFTPNPAVATDAP